MGMTHLRFALQILLTMIYSSFFATYAAADQQENTEPLLSYSAVQHIDTVPGPFVNKIYVSGDKERQDASLGGKVVTTIIRRDKGVAWLLIPSSKQYQEVELDATQLASIQAQFPDANKRLLSKEKLNARHTQKYAYSNADGSELGFAWVTNGVVVKSEIFEDLENGKPKATIRLKNLQFGKQQASLFEIPSGYLKQNSESF
jgi:hypothetical protein